MHITKNSRLNKGSIDDDKLNDKRAVKINQIFETIVNK